MTRVCGGVAQQWWQLVAVWSGSPVGQRRTVAVHVPRRREGSHLALPPESRSSWSAKVYCKFRIICLTLLKWQETTSAARDKVRELKLLHGSWGGVLWGVCVCIYIFVPCCIIILGSNRSHNVLSPYLHSSNFFNVCMLVGVTTSFKPFQSSYAEDYDTSQCPLRSDYSRSSEYTLLRLVTFLNNVMYLHHYYLLSFSLILQSWQSHSIKDIF